MLLDTCLIFFLASVSFVVIDHASPAERLLSLLHLWEVRICFASSRKTRIQIASRLHRVGHSSLFFGLFLCLMSSRPERSGCELFIESGKTGFMSSRIVVYVPTRSDWYGMPAGRHRDEGVDMKSYTRILTMPLY
jgi:hypothetical protein